jgi:hypothetical protein
LRETERLLVEDGQIALASLTGESRAATPPKNQIPKRKKKKKVFFFLFLFQLVGFDFFYCQC